LDQAENMFKADVPGGFQLGHAVEISASRTAGIEGWKMTSVPDGTEMFVGEESGCMHCLCCWMGSGPTYHIYEGNPMNGKEILLMQSHRLCCCTSPEVDVHAPDGTQEIAGADEHGCCCFSSTRVDVREQEVYKVSGHLLGMLSCCGASESDVRDMDGHTVGRITHTSRFMHIDFPEDARASGKAGLLAAAFLSELRSCRLG